MWAGDNFPWSPGSISAAPTRLPSLTFSVSAATASTQRTSPHRPYGSSSTGRETPTRPAVNADTSLCASEQHRHPDTPVVFVLRTQASSKPDPAMEHAGWPVSLCALGGN